MRRKKTTMSSLYKAELVVVSPYLLKKSPCVFSKSPIIACAAAMCFSVFICPAKEMDILSVPGTSHIVIDASGVSSYQAGVTLHLPAV